jgi:hypothetical protein
MMGPTRCFIMRASSYQSSFHPGIWSRQFSSMNELQSRGTGVSWEDRELGIRAHCWLGLMKTQLTEL